MKQAELFKTNKIEELKTKTKDLYNKIKGGLKVSKLGLGLTVSCLALGLLIFGFQYNQNQKYIQSQQLVELLKNENKQIQSSTGYQIIQVIDGLRQTRTGLQKRVNELEEELRIKKQTIQNYTNDIIELKKQI